MPLTPDKIEPPPPKSTEPPAGFGDFMETYDPRGSTQAMVPPPAPTPVPTPEVPTTDVGSTGLREAKGGLQGIVEQQEGVNPYLDMLETRSTDQLAAQQAYEATELKQRIARGELSGAASNAALGRLMATHGKQTVALQQDMYMQRAKLQQEAAQLATTLGISVANAEQTLATFQMEYPAKVLAEAGYLIDAGYSVDEVNSKLGTKITQDQVPILTAKAKLERAEVAGKLTTEMTTQAKLALSMGQDYATFYAANKNLLTGADGKPLITESQYNMLKTVPKTADDFFSEFIANGMIDPEKMIEDKGFLDLVANKYFNGNVRAEGMPAKVESLMKAWIDKNRPAFVSHIDGKIQNFIDQQGGDKALAWEEVKDNPELMMWAQYASGETDPAKIEKYLEGRFNSKTRTDIDAAMTYLKNEPAYKAFFDNPGVSDSIRTVLANSSTGFDNMFTTTINADDSKSYAVKEGFVFPWLDPETRYSYNTNTGDLPFVDWYGNDITYNWATDANGKDYVQSLSVNGGAPMYWENYFDQALKDKSGNAISGYVDGEGIRALTFKDMQNKWNSLSDEDKANYDDDGTIDLKAFAEAEFTESKPAAEIVDKNGVMNFAALSTAHENVATSTAMAWDNFLTESLKTEADLINSTLAMKDTDGDGDYEPSDQAISGKDGYNIQVCNPDGTYKLLNFETGADAIIIGKIYDQINAVYKAQNNGQSMTMKQFISTYGNGKEYVITSQGKILNFTDDAYKAKATGQYGKIPEEKVSGLIGFPISADALSTKVGKSRTDDPLAMILFGSDLVNKKANKDGNYAVVSFSEDKQDYKWEYSFNENLYRQGGLQYNLALKDDVKTTIKQAAANRTVFTIGGSKYRIDSDSPTMMHNTIYFGSWNGGGERQYAAEGIVFEDIDSGNRYVYIPNCSVKKVHGKDETKTGGGFYKI
jgi:hypothetical protein